MHPMQSERPHGVPTHVPASAADVTVKAVAVNVPRLRRAATRAARWLGADQPTVTRIALAVSEAASNSVLHAFPTTPGRMRVLVSEGAHDGDIEVRVSDDGIGLTPRPDSPGLGLGLGLIAEVADDLTISRLPRAGTEIVMRFAPRLVA
ncbi:MAG: hypothetical protein AVDCRST_MAG85-1162 [uncultured Solirubrobacteraceae bacterium]|uniref:Histidine kinase/HSP90-like ATPase domain-containing protein n=1 Tax=uncultured Solirubrobacteraceae bacterium TaxID=1162706 RepID=A0A6J4S5M7_9ACTN|nr:MAG: hypothetical protein AVDCRST_MAG85-1162 [uncultured Solirubrobacteraceae bacterium]